MDSEVPTDSGAGTPALNVGQPAPTKIRAIDRMRAAFTKRTWMYEVPGYPDEDGKPLRLYFMPLTSADVDAATIGVPEGAVVSPRENNVRTLITKARDENGQLLFAIGDLHWLMNEVPFAVLNDAVSFMYRCGSMTLREAEETLKNVPKSEGSSGSLAPSEARSPQPSTASPAL